MRNSTWKLAAVGVVLLLASGAAGAQQIGAASTTPVTTADCETAWASASASASCSSTGISITGTAFPNNCVVKADCDTGQGENTNATDYKGGPAGVENLVNCSGVLYETSCPLS